MSMGMSVGFFTLMAMVSFTWALLKVKFVLAYMYVQRAI